MDNIYKSLDENCGPTSASLADEFFSISGFLKPYVGDYKKNGVFFENHRYYDEREWRYIPKIEIKSQYSYSLTKNEFDNQTFLEEENEKLKELSIYFEPNDIKYIFVKTQSEIYPILKALRKIKGRNFTPEVVDILSSKILTTQQIKEDF